MTAFDDYGPEIRELKRLVDHHKELMDILNRHVNDLSRRVAMLEK